MIAETYKPKTPREAYRRYTPPVVQQQQQKQTQQGWPNSMPPDRPNHIDKMKADQFKITPEEFVRRDKIVRQMFLDTGLTYRAGDFVECRMEASREEYGKLLIRGVFKTYHDFPAQEAMQWPKDDKPYIFTVQPEKHGLDANGNARTSPRLVLCTADFFQPASNK